MLNNPYLNFYKGKKVFITGHTGFKGSWLAFLLHLIGAKVHGYSLSPLKNSLFNSLNLADKIESTFADIRDLKCLSDAMDRFEPDCVFHLAAQALVKDSYLDPINTYSTNVIGSLNLLESVRNSKSVRTLIYVTSDKCYENLEWIWGYRENDRLGGHDPYSSSKAAAVLIFSTYLKSFFSNNINIGIASVRAGNVIGGGDWAPNRIIPDAIRSILNNTSLVIRNPYATRPWQHVLEPLSGYLFLAYKLSEDPIKFQGSWNFGPSSMKVKNVGEIIDILFRKIGAGSIEIKQETSGDHEAGLLQLNCDKAHQVLNWHSKWNLEETLTATADWYKAYLNNDNVSLITQLQLNEYFGESL